MVQWHRCCAGAWPGNLFGPAFILPRPGKINSIDEGSLVPSITTGHRGRSPHLRVPKRFPGHPARCNCVELLYTRTLWQARAKKMPPCRRFQRLLFAWRIKRVYSSAQHRNNTSSRSAQTGILYTIYIIKKLILPNSTPAKSLSSGS